MKREKVNRSRYYINWSILIQTLLSNLLDKGYVCTQYKVQKTWYYRLCGINPMFPEINNNVLLLLVCYGLMFYENIKVLLRHSRQSLLKHRQLPFHIASVVFSVVIPP